MKKGVRILSIVFAIILAVIPIVTVGNSVKADEYDFNDIGDLLDYYGWNYEDSPEVKTGKTDDDFTPDDGDDRKEWSLGGYSFSASSYDISFGTMTRTDNLSDFQGLRITNTGTSAANLSYSKSDAEKAFVVDNPEKMYLAPGESTIFYIAMYRDMPAGQYYATLHIGSDNDPGYSQGVSVSLSGTIKDASPVVDSVSVSPKDISVTKGTSVNFGAIVRGQNNYSSQVEWSVSRNNSGSTYVDANGTLFVGNDESSDYIYVTATSVTDRTKYDYSTVMITSNKYTVSCGTNPYEGGSASGACTVNQGETVSVIAVPNNGYTFSNWVSNGVVVSNNPKYTFNVRQDTNLVANFTRSSCYIKVKTNHPEGGTVSESANIVYNGSYTIKATPKNGYEFNGWYEGDALLTNDREYTFRNVVTNHDVKAVFTQNAFSVNLQTNPTDKGNVYGFGTYNKGQNVSISAKPVDGYEFTSWTLNNEVISYDPNLTIQNIQKDYVLVANFSKKNIPTFTIKALVAGGKGSVSPEGVTTVNQGQSLIYTFAPANGYIIAGVAVDGNQIGAVNSYSFNNINAHHSIAVAFAPRPEPTATPKPEVPTDVKPSASPTMVPTIAPTAEPAHTVEPVVPFTPAPDIDVVPVDDEGNPKTPDEMPSVSPEYDISDDWPAEIVIPDAPFIDNDSVRGVLQNLNLTPVEARIAIEDGNDRLLLEEAAREQFLKVTVRNEFANTVMATESDSYFNVPSVPNMGEVVSSLLTTDEKIYTLSGNEAGINLSIFNTTGLTTQSEKEIKKVATKDNINIGTMFEVVLIKDIDGSSKVITDTSVPLVIKVNVPQELRDANRTFCVIRSHRQEDGSILISYLKDEDDDPNTVTFSTDKFSSYAIGYTGGTNGGGKTSPGVIVLIIFIIIGMISTLIVGMIIGERRQSMLRHRRVLREHRSTAPKK